MIRDGLVVAGLDPAERNRFHGVLAEVAADAVALLSTHILGDVENLCGRLPILSAGRFVAERTPQEMRAPPQGRLWIRLVPRQEEAPGDPLHLAAAPTGTRVIVEAERRAVGDKVTA